MPERASSERGYLPGWRSLSGGADSPRRRGAYLVHLPSLSGCPVFPKYHRSSSAIPPLYRCGTEPGWGVRRISSGCVPGTPPPRTGNGSPRIPCFLEFWQSVPGTGCVVLEIDPGEIRDPYPSRRNKNSVEALCVSTEFPSERCICVVCRWGYYITKIRIFLLISIANICYLRSRRAVLISRRR